MDKLFATYSIEELENHYHILIHLNHHDEFSDRIREVIAEFKRRKDQ